MTLYFNYKDSGVIGIAKGPAGITHAAWEYITIGPHMHMHPGHHAKYIVVVSHWIVPHSL